MGSDIKQLELETHLTEYSALRDEILALIKWRDSLVFISLSISGALFSFAFSNSTLIVKGVLTHWTPLYLVTPLASIVGGLWMVNTWRIHRIGNYIRDITANRIKNLLRQPQNETKFSSEPNIL